jgi:curved DNA-binding protein CbpA
LPRGAHGSEIRAAYRRQALATHPDKGGDPDNFRRVVAAFEELGDESRRAAYDRNLELFGSRDGSGSPQMPPTKGTTAAPQPPNRAGAWSTASWTEDVARWWYGAARVALYKLMGASQKAWASQVAGMQEAELQALNDLLRGAKVLVPAQSGDREGAANRRRQASPERTADTTGYQGIERTRNGYRVVVSWATMSIATSYTESLAQAIDWQIALSWLRSTAQGRLEEYIGQAADPLIEE